jgi:hypothetical protein
MAAWTLALSSSPGLEDHHAGCRSSIAALDKAMKMAWPTSACALSSCSAPLTTRSTRTEDFRPFSASDYFFSEQYILASKCVHALPLTLDLAHGVRRKLCKEHWLMCKNPEDRCPDEVLDSPFFPDPELADIWKNHVKLIQRIDENKRREAKFANDLAVPPRYRAVR